MVNYTPPRIEIIEFDDVDVIVTSSESNSVPDEIYNDEFTSREYNVLDSSFWKN